MPSSKELINNVKDFAKKSVDKIDVEDIKSKAVVATKQISTQAVKVKDAAIDLKDDIELKITELDRELEQSITDYNNIYTIMSDNGYALYTERLRSVDSINNIEELINSIANHPKSFDTDFESIDVVKNTFIGTCEFAERELNEARKSAEGAGAGIAAGATVACMAPTAAMWVAMTFGTASTGTAISTLTGAAASKAALAWLGGGALSAGGGGVAAGNALLALSGPIGWGIAGATLLTSIVLFSKNKIKLNKEKSDEIEAINCNAETIKEINSKLDSILSQTKTIKENLNKSFIETLPLYGKDYATISSDDKLKLGALVNNTKSLAALFKEGIE